MSQNEIGSPPYFQAHKNITIKTDRFYKKSPYFKAFYAPESEPDNGESEPKIVYNHVAAAPFTTGDEFSWGFEANKYVPPEKWAKNNSLLRMPQVIYLSQWYLPILMAGSELRNTPAFDAGTQFPEYHTTYLGTDNNVRPFSHDPFYMFVRNDRFNSRFDISDTQSIVVFDNGQPDPFHTVIYIGEVNSVWPIKNIVWRLYSDLIDAVQELQEYFASVRPGRTFISAPDWTGQKFFEDLNFTETTDFYSPINIKTKSARYWSSNRVPCILSPKSSETDWLGTNFLNIYVGHVGIDGSPVNREIYGYLGDDDYNTVLGLVSPAIENLKANYKKFFKYGTWFYGTSNLNWTGIEPYEVLYPSNLETGGDISVFNAATDGIAADVSEDAKNMYREIYQNVNINNDNYLIAIAGALEDYNFSYRGTSDLLNVEYLKTEIARYFKFDPGSGKDLIKF